MTASIFLVSRDPARVSTVNGVRAVLVNKPHGSSNAVVIASAVSLCNAAYNDIVGPSGNAPEALDYNTQDAFDAKYFDTVHEIAEDSAALIAGQLATDKQGWVMDPGAGLVAGTAAV